MRAFSTAARWRRLAVARSAHCTTATVLSILLTGCAWHYPPADRQFTPEAAAPDPVRIAQLAQQAVIPNGEPTAFLRLSAAVVFAGNPIRLTCFVPPNAKHRALRLAYVDAAGVIRNSTQQGRYNELFIERAPCGEFVAICDSLGTFGRVLSHQERAFESKGMCNDGG